MNTQRNILFVTIIIVSIIVLFASIYDVLYEKQWLQIILALYAILFIFTILLLIVISTKKAAADKDMVQEFEKTLKGKLYHFKCPNCHGIFAIKKSKRNNKKPFSLTCPDCGTIGKIASSPPVVIEKIPDQKSENVKFKCNNCGERVSIWAEGTELFQNIQICSCPYCGEKQSMKNI